MEDEEIYYDCWDTGEIVCPYCGYNFDHSDKLFDNNGTRIVVECKSCGREFISRKSFEVVYSSEKALIGECQDCKERTSLNTGAYHKDLGIKENVCCFSCASERYYNRLRKK